jgi:hypothetical protein
MPGFEYEFSGLNIYETSLNEMLHSPTGDVGKHMRRVGLKIVAAAKAQVGVKTGRLQKSIGMMHSRDGLGQFLKIGSNVDYALAHHNGTRAHDISARPGDDVLRFSKSGRVVYSRNVVHPGTRPNRYLTDNLKLVKI